MLHPGTAEIRPKTRQSVRYDPSSVCSCDFDELLGVHVAALCDALRKTPVFSCG